MLGKVQLAHNEHLHTTYTNIYVTVCIDIQDPVVINMDMDTNSSKDISLDSQNTISNPKYDDFSNGEPGFSR